MELEARGVAIDLSLRYLKDRLLYEPCDLRASQLEQLYQAGFETLTSLIILAVTKCWAIPLLSRGYVAVYYSIHLRESCELLQKAQISRHHWGSTRCPYATYFAFILYRVMIWGS
ncbi:hypothetical protein BJX62DRAFT_193330 [Aspergillus germanicus]